MAATINLSGDLDLYRKPDLQKTLSTVDNFDIAILDLSGVAFIDASALGCFIALRKRMLKQNGRGVIRIVGANRAVSKIMVICGLDKVFEICDESAPSSRVTELHRKLRPSRHALLKRL